MAIHPLNNLAHENQLKPLKFQRFKEKDQKANGVVSFWAFLFSIFIFISIFYIFSLSPSSLLNTTKFWFCISNALILIIAVDFGASKKQAEIYQEYVEKGVGNIIRFPSTLEYQYPEKEIAKPSINPPQLEKEDAKTDIPPQKEKNLQEAPEEEKEVNVVDVHVVSESESSENIMQVVVNDDLKMSVEEDEGKMVELPPELDHGEVHEEEKGIETSTGTDEKGGGGQGQGQGQGEEDDDDEEKEDDDDDDDDDDAHDDEFSKMSNEELNRRVEEFIQRFNRQIRIQAAQNRIEQMQTVN